MFRKIPLLFVVMTTIIGLASFCYAGKIPPPEQAGDGFKIVTVENAKKMLEQGATIIACHSHTTDYMKGHPEGTLHITCMVPKDHKRTDMALKDVDFDVQQLPADKNTAIIMYCASNT